MRSCPSSRSRSNAVLGLLCLALPHVALSVACQAAGEGDAALEPPDSVEDDAAADSDASTGGDSTLDSRADVEPCDSDRPEAGCPCKPSKDKACCTDIAQGLTCSAWSAEDGGPRWTVFWDCGCWEVPECDAYPLYRFCGASNEPPPVLECDGTPKKGCPCDFLPDRPCCTTPNDVLYCTTIGGEEVWHSDPTCGCSTEPSCEGFPQYEACAGSER